MKALVVYDSFFGNTELIAGAIGSALGPREDMAVLRVGAVKPEHLMKLDVLIVGSPTRGFRPSPAINDFLEHLPNLNGITVAAFDTRLSMSDQGSSLIRFIVNAGGYAAKQIAEKLEKSRGRLVLPPEGFLVVSEKGPLKTGELERAADWAAQILALR